MRTLIKNVLLIDGLGNQLPNSRIDIIDKVIADFGPAKDAPPEAQYDIVIDGAGKTAIPGLINCHVHLGMNAGAHPMNAMAASTPLQVLMQAIENVQKMLRKRNYNGQRLWRQGVRNSSPEGQRKKGSGARSSHSGFSGNQDYRRSFYGPRCRRPDRG